ncbi:MAG: hypothetical protein H7A25_17785 [Leptospiraceae bacterium]|nr:hypothetical protein [Leptospiraceae bacterium]
MPVSVMLILNELWEEADMFSTPLKKPTRAPFGPFLEPSTVLNMRLAALAFKAFSAVVPDMVDRLGILGKLETPPVIQLPILEEKGICESTFSATQVPAEERAFPTVFVMVFVTLEMAFPAGPRKLKAPMETAVITAV